MPSLRDQRWTAVRICEAGLARYRFASLPLLNEQQQHLRHADLWAQVGNLPWNSHTFLNLNILIFQILLLVCHVSPCHSLSAVVPQTPKTMAASEPPSSKQLACDVLCPLWPRRQHAICSCADARSKSLLSTERGTFEELLWLQYQE